MRLILLFFAVLLAGAVAAQGTGSTLPPGDASPPTASDLIKKAGTAADYDSAAYVVVLDSVLNRVTDLGISYVDGYMLYKVLTEKGCRELSVITKGYEPLSSYAEIRAVAIIRGDSVIDVPMAEARDLPAPQSMIYWGDRLKMLQLPRLQVGDGVEIKTFRKGYSYALLDSASASGDERYIPPMPGQYFDIVLFESTFPMVKKKYVLQLPSDKRLHSRIYNGPAYNSTTYRGDTTTYAWWVEDMKAWEPQPSRPDETDIVTKVVLATVESWEAKSRWFFEVNEGQFQFTDAIKAKVDEILAAAGVSRGTEEEKAFELVHWVAQSIRYSGQTMGKGEGYTLHPGSMIFEQRSGVCKDIAGMLVTMMRAAGLDSYAAMTMAGSRIEEIPADQFNHCVVALRMKDGRFVMYDPTWVPYYRDIWSKFETEQHYLIGTPQGQALSQIPYSPPEESPLRFRSTARLAADGTLEGTFRFEGDGAADSRLRGLANWYPKPELKNILANMLHYISNGVELVSFTHGELLDFRHSMWWEISYRIPEYALPVAGVLEFKSPMMQFAHNSRALFRPAAAEWPEERHDDLFFYATLLLDGIEEVTLPAGYKVADPPSSEKIDETYASFWTESRMDKGKLVLKEEARLKRRQIPPDGYEGFRKAIKELKDFTKTVFRAEKGESR